MKLALQARTLWSGYDSSNPISAEPITVGSTATGQIDDSFETDMAGGEPATRYYKDFQFTLDEPTNIKLTARPYYGETQLSLVDADGTTLKGAGSRYDLEQDRYGDLILDCGRLAAGTHYIRYSTVEPRESGLNALNNRFNLSVQAGHEMYRLYNPNTGEHLYTADTVERDAMVGNGWNDEGVAWYAPVTSDYPVYRLYNPNNGDHHYTASLDEYNQLGALGWNQEDIAFYSVDDPAGTGHDGVTVHRLFNPNAEGAGAHHYVRLDNGGQTEFSQLLKDGWSYEGRGWTGLRWD